MNVNGIRSEPDVCAIATKLAASTPAAHVRMACWWLEPLRTIWFIAGCGLMVAGLGLGVAAMVSGAARAAGDAPATRPKMIFSIESGRLSLDATDAPLESLLAAVAREAGFALDVMGGLPQTVSDSFVGLALYRAIPRLLGNASFVITLLPAKTESGVQEIQKLLVVRRKATGDRQLTAPAHRRNARTPAEKKIERWRTRYREVRMLGRDRSPEASERLSDLLVNDRDPAVRLQAAKALASVRHDSAVEALISAIDDQTTVVSRRAIVSLGKIGGKKAANLLIDILRFGMDWQDQVLAARALSRQPTPRNREALAAATRNSNAQVRKAAGRVCRGSSAPTKIRGCP